jgi:uracil-DNA glycosylase family 4
VQPPSNRDPQDHEVEACIGFLHAQISAVNPKVNHRPGAG